MSDKKRKHVHFMGICGSGCASIAMLAHAEGYRVTGCDQSDTSYYAQELKKLEIPIFTGHAPAHLEDDVDYVAVSPALFDICPDNPELLLARERGILMTWQEFMGRYLQEDKRVIAIAGTHGKTTTTFLTAEILTKAGVDPTVVGGSVYKPWGNGGRKGDSDFFLCEADEFNYNFLNYKPETAVLNNVEMDHPECYDSYEAVVKSFTRFVCEGGRLKTLIFNADSKGAAEVFENSVKCGALKNVDVYAFKKNAAADGNVHGEGSENGSGSGEAVYDFKDVKSYNVVTYRTLSKTEEGTEFEFTFGGSLHRFFTSLFGDYNVSNAVVASLIAKLLGVSDEVLAKPLQSFPGVGRRFDRVGEMKNVPVFDDYAHHPTAIRSVLGMVREYFSGKKVVAVFEPHQVSRLRLMLDDYAATLLIADHVVVTKTHIGREVNKDVTPIAPEEWSAYSDRFHYEEDYQKVKDYVSNLIDQGECGIIVVIGAANSYRISRLMTET